MFIDTSDDTGYDMKFNYNIWFRCITTGLPSKYMFSLIIHRKNSDLSAIEWFFILAWFSKRGFLQYITNVNPHYQGRSSLSWENSSCWSIYYTKEWRNLNMFCCVCLKPTISPKYEESTSCRSYIEISKNISIFWFLNIEDSYFIATTSLQNIMVTYCIEIFAGYEWLTPATLNNSSVILFRQFYWWRKQVTCLESLTNIITRIGYISPRTGIELATLTVIGNDQKDRRQSNYHTITPWQHHIMRKLRYIWSFLKWSCLLYVHEIYACMCNISRYETRMMTFITYGSH